MGTFLPHQIFKFMFSAHKTIFQSSNETSQIGITHVASMVTKAQKMNTHPSKYLSVKSMELASFQDPNLQFQGNLVPQELLLSTLVSTLTEVD